MRRFKTHAAALAAASLALTLAGCAGSPDAAPSSGASTNSSMQQSDSSDAASQEGEPLFNFLGDRIPEFVDFASNFDPKDISGITYSHDERDDKWIEDEGIVASVFDGLSQMTVLGPYSDDVFVTDSNESIAFKTVDGKTFEIHFDFGNLVCDGEYYEVGNDKAFNSAMIYVESYSEGNDIS